MTQKYLDLKQRVYKISLTEVLHSRFSVYNHLVLDVNPQITKGIFWLTLGVHLIKHSVFDYETLEVPLLKFRALSDLTKAYLNHNYRVS